METIEILMQCPLFTNIKKEDITSILICVDGKKNAFRKGETIMEEGKPLVRLGIVLSGEVQVIRDDYYGNRSILLQARPSEMFGEAFACAGLESMPVSVVATQDTQLLLIKVERIIRTCNNACEFHNQMVHNLLRVVALKNLECNQKLDIISKRTTREKLMTYLMYQAEQHEKEEFDIPFDRQSLADYLEVERSGLSTELGKLRRDGILECYKNHFILKRKRDFNLYEG